ncbi:Deoxyhypusine hydroxylase [Eumeta japonica]|uniref:Deoxyhypusine hydroxylase n=1 Tax=Eumeta variegata TaxID=151549 RepID=A0A4C1VJ10_EUMVA|nr:Deoxyhypusine hydroxylase [Eumeta japonica]
MLCVWWDPKGIIRYELLPPSKTINSVHYSKELTRLKQEIEKKRLELINRMDIMTEVSEIAVKNIGRVLNDPTRPMKQRFRALFTLRNLGGETAIKCISKCFKDESVLLKHELAYCLGQMQDKTAIPILTKVLEDISQDPIVRHEAGEALGALGYPELRELLVKYQHDPAVEVAETCQIALQRLAWLANVKESNLTYSKYASIDPAPPSPETDVVKLKDILMDEKQSLFARYRAMFSLRNLGTTESINALGEGLKASSALFRHEVAFVFGQMQDERSIPFLKQALEDTSEHEMVRHEAAEALGAIATDECTEVLKSEHEFQWPSPLPSFHNLRPLVSPLSISQLLPLTDILLQIYIPTQEVGNALVTPRKSRVSGQDRAKFNKTQETMTKTHLGTGGHNPMTTLDPPLKGLQR